MRRFLLAPLLLVSLSPLPPVFGQTEAVVKTPSTNALTESIVIKSGTSLTINSGATITNNGTATGFGSGGAWGTITGTLSNQTDLNTALGLKANSADLGALATLSAVTSATITDGTIVNADISTSAAIALSKLADSGTFALGATGQIAFETTALILSSAGITAEGDITANTLGGNGASITALNASNLSSGTVAAARMPALTGDVTTSAGGVATTIATDAVGPTQLASTAVTAGSYTNANVTVDADGRLTAASNGSGGVATDTIFDAAGDLVQGTGANTSARVALGTSGQLLRVKSDLTGVEWATVSGTGTVTSVAISGSDGIDIDSGSPITASGTIALGINASTLKTHLSLANVENTALSTWAGTTNITTLGTIAAGTWNGTAIGTGYLASGATLDTEWDTASEINAATTDADFLTTTLAASTYAPLTGAAFTGANTTTLALTTTPTAASSLINSATATVGAQKVSPSIVWTGSGWKTTATAAGQEVSFRANVLPEQGSTAPTGTWQLQSQINGGGFTDRLTVTSAGVVTATGFYGTTFQGTSFNDANLVTGSENTALGIGALTGNATGSGNTALGDFAAAFIADATTDLSAATNGVYIGAITRGSTINESNAIVIGYNALSEGSNKTVIGNSSTTAAHIFGTVSASTFSGALTGNATTATTLATARTINGVSFNGSANIVLPEVIVIAISDETTALTTGTAKVTFRMPFAMTLTAVRLSTGTAPTGSTIIVDINESGSTIMTTNKLSIDASEKTSTTAATAAGITDTALADDAEITIDIDQIGSSVAGAGAKVTLIGTR